MDTLVLVYDNLIFSLYFPNGANFLKPKTKNMKTRAAQYSALIAVILLWRKMTARKKTRLSAVRLSYPEAILRWIFPMTQIQTVLQIDSWQLWSKALPRHNLNPPMKKKLGSQSKVQKIFMILALNWKVLITRVRIFRVQKVCTIQVLKNWTSCSMEIPSKEAWTKNFSMVIFQALK